jgi:hypothetical protein
MAADLEEDFPGQRTEYERHAAVEKAVTAADAIILEASDGSKEVTDYLTIEVAKRFLEKVECSLNSNLSRHDMLDRIEKRRGGNT